MQIMQIIATKRRYRTWLLVPGIRVRCPLSYRAVNCSPVVLNLSEKLQFSLISDRRHWQVAMV